MRERGALVIGGSIVATLGFGGRSSGMGWLGGSGLRGRRTLIVVWAVGLLSCVVVVAPARAAFPGRNGSLVVAPLRGPGLILVSPAGGDQRRICTVRSVCGHPTDPRFSPDGRAIVFAGPAIHLVGTDGSCMNCYFGASLNPDFVPTGRLVTFVSGGKLLEDGIDGLREATITTGVRGVSDAVWSDTGRLAVVAMGRIWAGKPGRLHLLGTGGAPSWSPDGSHIVIARDGWITILRAVGGVARRLVAGTAPAFSPDGRWIAFIGAGHRLEIIRASGGRARTVGRIPATAVDWQAVLPHPAACVPPPGSKVIASSPEAIVTSDAGPATEGAGGLPDTAVMGCLTAVGRERLLARSTFNSPDVATDYPLAAVGGTYATILVHGYDAHYGGDSESVQVTDLRAGGRSGYGGETAGCGSYEPACGGIDQVLVGADGVSAVHVNGGPTSPGNTDQLFAVCASPSLCLASNRFGDVLSSTSPLSSPWSAAPVASFSGASCPSPSLCVLVSGSSIYTSTNPGGGASAWTATQLPNSPELLNVDCPTVTLCVATTLEGQVVVSSDPTGGPAKWSTYDVDGRNAMYGISCASSSECVATDIPGNVITTTNPTGGANAWTVRQVSSPVFGLVNVSCPSNSLCVASGLGGLLTSTDPITGPWTRSQQVLSNDITCPSASFCVQVGGSTIRTSTEPGADSWSSFTVSDAPNLMSVSCPTTSFCVAAGAGDGQLLVSTNPAGGPNSWVPVLADRVSCPIAPGACGTEKIIASDRTGPHVLDTSTEFEVQTGPQLTALSLAGNTFSWQHQGTQMSAELSP